MIFKLHWMLAALLAAICSIMAFYLIEFLEVGDYRLAGLTISKSFQIKLKDENGYVYFSGSVDNGKSEKNYLRYCQGFSMNDTALCLEDHMSQMLLITEEEKRNKEITCQNFKHKALRCLSQTLLVCYELSHQHWYGGFETFNQFWPLKNAMSNNSSEKIENIQLPLLPYVSGDFGIHKTVVANVLERLFISSSGVGVLISRDSPLYLSFNAKNDNQLCLSAKFDNVHFVSSTDEPPVLEYTVCKASNIRKIYDYMKNKFIDKPQGKPSLHLLHKPIWSTWAQFNRDINQSKVLDFANNILKYDLPYSQLEIDDQWSHHYGDLDFDRSKFPEPKQMVVELTKKGFPVTLWIHPFFSLQSEAFQEAFSKKFIIMSKGGKTPALVSWWNDKMSAILDVTNPAAVHWFHHRLSLLKDLYNISSFKFDAGEAHFVPHGIQTYQLFNSTNDYSTLWSELAMNFDPSGRRQEVRVGWKTQKLPMFVRLFDRMSSWDRDGGLITVIPSVLTLGLIGYPFVLPDMIGGNAYADSINFAGGAYPDRELYIRWLELSVFLPSLQFSVVPWHYDDSVVNITNKFLDLREEYFETFTKLADESVATGHPIIRPIWWIAPLDDLALVIEDEYLLGDDLLVAPVMKKGARARDIYLPEGVWADQLRGGYVKGPHTFYNYRIELDELAYFKLQ